MHSPRPVLRLALVLLLPACAGASSPAPAAPAVAGGGAEAVRIDAALAVAARTRRNVLVEYVSGDCNWCEKMEREVYPDPAVQRELRGVVRVRVEKGPDDGPFTGRWGDPGTPSFVVLRPDGRQAGDLLTGALSRDSFLTYVAWARTGDGPLPPVKPFGA